jgi:ABC-type multidrug transport system fused ATPase/permease subunit
MPVKLFFCYAHEDEILLNKLRAHLKPIQRQGLIDVWHDRDISAGTEWEQAIKERLNMAEIILLLVSPDFMNSDYCYSVEMKRALERHTRYEARVIPIILRPVYWQGAPFGQLQALPTDGKPITDWRNREKALFTVAEGIRKAVEEQLSSEKILYQTTEVVADEASSYSGPHKLQGEISFEHVSFSYTKNQPILKGINLFIPAGHKVALVGHPGSGKTTLINLILRSYEVQRGSVKIDGVDNRRYPLQVLRENVSIVLQDCVLLERTIRENIAIGRSGATEQEIIEVAREANIHETIMNLPAGYSTYLREGGKYFSPVQRLRLAIARALLRDAPILILDDPTANLDVESEAEFMNALDRLVVGRTVLVIARRLRTLGNVDEIIVFKDGHIVEQGTFKDLKRKGGEFAKLLAEQNPSISLRHLKNL